MILPVEINWTAILYYALPTLLVALVAHIIYLRYFHPLASFPGPFLASITNLYAVYIYFTWRMEEIEAELHRKYGPIVRIQPDYLSFSSPTALPIIYHRTADKDPDFYFSGSLGIGPCTFASITHETHAFYRKRVANAFNMSSAMRLAPIITARLTTFHSVLSRFCKTEEKVDFCEWIMYAAYDIISHVAFGAPFGFLDKGSDIHGLASAKEMGLPMFILGAKLPFVRMLLNSPLMKRLLPNSGDKEGIGAAMGVRDRLYAERMEMLKANGGKQGNSDILQSLIDNNLTETEVKDELLTIMLAGSDTIAITIWLTLVRVLQTPGVYDRLLNELRSANLSSPVPQYAELQSCAYFQAVIKEGLRIDPAGALYSPRMVPKEGYTVNGQYIPGGTKVGYNPFVTNRNKEFWGQDAEVFRPERWMQPECDEKEAKRLEAMIGTWSYGSRVCMGKPLAMLEVQMTMGMILTNFRPELVDVEKQGKRKNKANVMMKGLWMKFHPLAA